MADITRATLIEKLLAENAKAMRMPRHWTEDRAAIHARINLLLTQMEMLAEAEAAALEDGG